jgi:hypothetical protein
MPYFPQHNKTPQSKWGCTVARGEQEQAFLRRLLAPASAQEVFYICTANQQPEINSTSEKYQSSEPGPFFPENL